MDTDAVSVPCHLNDKQPIRIESGELVHCDALMNFSLSGGCRSDGCPYLHPNAVRKCPLVQQGQVVGRGFIKPESYTPLFLQTA